MKRATRKLVVRSETLRVLRALDNADLARAVGGGADPGLVEDSNGNSGINCPAVLAAAVVS